MANSVSVGMSLSDLIKFNSMLLNFGSFLQSQ